MFFRFNEDSIWIRFRHDYTAWDFWQFYFQKLRYLLRFLWSTFESFLFATFCKGCCFIVTTRHCLKETLVSCIIEFICSLNLCQNGKYILPAIISAFLDSCWAAFSASSFANSALINSSLACFSNSLAILSCLLFSLA